MVPEPIGEAQCGWRHSLQQAKVASAEYQLVGVSQTVSAGRRRHHRKSGRVRPRMLEATLSSPQGKRREGVLYWVCQKHIQQRRQHVTVGCKHSSSGRAIALGAIGSGFNSHC